MSDTKIAKFKVSGIPMAKQRPQFTTKTGRAYTPVQTLNYENLVKMAYLQDNKEVFWDCEVMEMEIYAVFAIPKSIKGNRFKMCLAGLIAPSSKDVDNIAKIICDALNGIAYNDDKHIVKLKILKLYTDDIKSQGVYVKIKSYTQDSSPILIGEW